jgi:hypothetical protein
VHVKKEQQDRESSLERLMRDALRAPASDVSETSDAGGCLDTDTLAAWAEQTLSARDRTALETHAAGCTRCQSMLAAMARTTPVPVTAPWWRVHMMAWMVPATAGAAALVVWMTLPSRPGLESRQAATHIAAPSMQPAPAVQPAPVTSSPARKFDDLDAITPPATDRAPRAAPAKETVSEQARTRQEFRRANADDKQAVSSLAKTEAVAAEPKANAEASAAAQPASPAPAPLAPPPDAPPAPAPRAAPPPARAVGGALAGATNASEARGDRLMARAAAAPVVQILSPNPSNRWRLLPGGAVQHSTDGGSTWETQATGADVTLTTGASPAPLVCWLIGPRGRVLLSRDGATWKAVPVAQPLDLVSIRATDDTSATVTAADGRRFATVDGGATWTPR